MANEIEVAKQVNEIKTMKAEDVSQLTVSVVEATKSINEVNAEIDVLSAGLVKLDKAKDEYDRKVRIIRGQLTDLAVKL